jgi:hypothetical protein
MVALSLTGYQKHFFLNELLALYAGTCRGYVDVFGCVDTWSLGGLTNFLGGRNIGGKTN